MKEASYSRPHIVRFCLYEIFFIKRVFRKHFPGLFSIFFLSENDELVLHIGLVICFVFVSIKIILILVYSTRSNSSAFVMF